jgi:ubiquinone/menaquinone biosynthesis C-methylase UbiE
MLEFPVNTYRFHEFDIPISLLNLTGGGVETFELISRHHLAALRKHINLKEVDQVLEIGCGIGRDAIPLTKILSPQAKYYGIDIIKSSIEFCQQNISARYQNFTFFHFDVGDKLHNPSGVRQMTEYRLPIEDQTLDKVFGWSVFTHMWERDIRHYLAEFYRVLKPGGQALLTCFVLTPEVLAKARQTNLTQFNLMFEHQVDDRCWVNDLEFPLGAIGYSPAALLSMVSDARLSMQRDFLRGAWSGYYDDPEDGQDALVLVRL